jgi:tRNA (guanine-N7-)-methyltransferase
LAIRVRQHVNPLSIQYLVQVPPPIWENVYANPQQPLHLDIGCGWGSFLFDIAQLEPSYNFLGLEIREPLVEKALAQRDKLGLTNLHFIFCSANASLSGLLASLPADTLQRVTIQFPDPWFKTRHAKRRVVQPELVSTLGKYLAPGGMVFLQSDVEEVAEEMQLRFQENSTFTQQHDQPWFGHNPFPAQTDRERLTLSRNDPVYRALFMIDVDNQ